MDDLCLVGDAADIQAVKDSVLKHFEHREVLPERDAHGDMVRTFLGIQVVHKGRTIALRQPALCEKMVRDHAGEGARLPARSTPVTKQEIEKFERAARDNPTHLPTTYVTKKSYRQFVGALLYLVAGVRFDLAWAAQRLSTKLDNPDSVDLQI